MTSLAIASVLAISGAALSDAPNERHIAADASFIVHIDFEHAAETTLGHLAMKLAAESDDSGWLEQITTDLGIEFGDDIHGMTVYGATDDEPVILIYGSPALERWDEALAAEQDDPSDDTIRGRPVREINLGDDQGLGVLLQDDNRTLWVVAGGLRDLDEAVDVVAGDADSADLEDWPIEGPPRGTLVYVGVNDFEALSEWDPASDIASRASGFSFALGERRGTAFVRAQLTAEDEEEAGAIVQIAEGLRGLGKLVARDDPELRQLIEFAGAIDLSADGPVVTAFIEHDVEEVIEMLEHIEK